MKTKLEHAFNKILLTGQQDIYLNGLSLMLQRMGAAIRISRLCSHKELKAFLQSDRPYDLVILVSPLIKQNGNTFLNKLFSMNPNCIVMLMADDHEIPLVFSYVKEGIKAIVSKTCSETQIIQALNAVAKKSYYISPSFSDAVISRGLNSLSVKGNAKLVQISDREKEIIRLMWKDFTSKEIAEQLKVSLRTIESHRNNIYEKLNVKTLGGIFKYGLENGIIS